MEKGEEGVSRRKAGGRDGGMRRREGRRRKEEGRKKQMEREKKLK